MSTDQGDLNDFQRQMEVRLSGWLQRLGMQIDSRRVHRETIPFLRRAEPETVLQVSAGDLDVAIRQDSVGYTIAGKNYAHEMADYARPDALADAWLTALTKRWQEHHEE